MYRWCLLACCLFLAACHPKSDSAPTPTPIAGSGNLSISPVTDLLKIRATQQFVANAKMVDGTLAEVEATWGSDTPAVATVTAKGQATGVSVGETTIFAEYLGSRAVQRLKVVPDYDGVWSGAYRVTTCTDSLDFAGACAEESLDTLWRLDLTLTQDRQAVSATMLAFSVLPGTAAGTIASTGQLTMAGTQSTVISDRSWTLEIKDWRSQTTDSLSMTGTFSMVLTVNGIAGSITYNCVLDTVVHTSLSLPGPSSVPAIGPVARPAPAAAPWRPLPVPH